MQHEAKSVVITAQMEFIFDKNAFTEALCGKEHCRNVKPICPAKPFGSFLHNFKTHWVCNTEYQVLAVLITSLSKTTDQAATAVKPNVCPI
jgi:hypothetical protein